MKCKRMQNICPISLPYFNILMIINYGPIFKTLIYNYVKI